MPDRSSGDFLARPSPRMPRHDGTRASAAFGATSLLIHATALAAIVALASASSWRSPSADKPQRNAAPPVETQRMVYVAMPPRSDPGGGGGGGGNRETAPIPRAQAPGRDPLTLPVAAPIVPSVQPFDQVPAPQALLLDARPLTSGFAFQVGSLDGARTLGTSQGPGYGGGVGEGIGTGIGPGRGQGIGAGSGGGTGGGVYRPGSGVTLPTVTFQVKPAYTDQALRAKIQGSVFLEVIVQADGTPREIRVIRSLDPFGLDREAIRAVEQ